MKSTEHELWQDEYAAARRERDRQREQPQRLFPLLREGPLRNNTHTVKLPCPACGDVIFVAADSDAESVLCMSPGCHAPLETRQVDGKVVLEMLTLDGGSP